jgi:predicted esterase
VIDRNPRAYRGYVSASSSITDDLRNVGRYPILMLHGERDPGFALPDFKRSKDWLVRKGAKVEATTWDASHWLILSHREEVSHRIRAFAGM